MGRRYFHLSPEARGNTRVLEAGCGNGCNLWMLEQEGFDATGLDIDPVALGKCDSNLKVELGDMAAMPFKLGAFNLVIDVFSSYALTQTKFELFLDEVNRVLDDGGRFFSYAPSTGSDAVQRHLKDWAYAGAASFRFIDPAIYQVELEKRGFDVVYRELASRTYQRGKEYFEFVVIEAVRR
jgi:SAM-dependent methyltransferase